MRVSFSALSFVALLVGCYDVTLKDYAGGDKDQDASTNPTSGAGGEGAGGKGAILVEADGGPDAIAQIGPTGTGTPPASYTVTERVDLGTVPAGATVPGRVNVNATTALTDLMCSVVGVDLTQDSGVVGTCTSAVAAGASCVIAFNFTSATPGVKTGDQIVCTAGGVVKITVITATVVPRAKLIINPRAGEVTTVVEGDPSNFTFAVANSGGVNSGVLSAAINPANPDFAVSGTTCAAGLAPLATCTVTVTFKPATAGSKTGTLAITDSGAPTTPVTATLTGVAKLPSRLVLSGVPDFGAVTAGRSSVPLAFTLKNTGGVDANGVTVATNDVQFSIGSNTCTGVTLAATTGTCTFTITFSPAASASTGIRIRALVTANSQDAGPVSLDITGTATKPPTIVITPNPLAVDGQPLNVQSGSKVLTVTNTGASSTGAITIPTSLGNGFIISGSTCAAALDPAGTCTIAIRFTPNAIAQATFTMTVSSASGATGSAMLTGTGRQPNVLTISPVNVTACSATSPTSPCFTDTNIGQADGSRPLTPASADAPVMFMITNSTTGPAGGISLESGPVTVTISGANAADFVINRRNCGPSLLPGQTCLYVVSFAPLSATGARVATLIATSGNGGNVGATMAAYALPAI